jgi:DNA-binding NtrC family response regulator
MGRMILIVDDEERILFVLERALAKLGDDLGVETATTAEEALHKAGQRSYDLVISDLIMPDMDGIELTERIRELRSEAAVVWMTAYGCRSFKEDAERLDVHCCVEKPLEIQGFREVVQQALSLQDAGSDGQATGQRPTDDTRRFA